MQHISISQIRHNPLTSSLYLVDSNFENLVNSIALFGVLEPLIVFPIADDSGYYQVVSGNRRLNAAKQLDLSELPCSIIKPVEITEALVSAHQEQRVKLPSDIIRELRIIEEEFGLRQGVRSKDPKIERARAYKEGLVKEFNKSNIDRLRQYDKKVRELVDDNPQAYKKYMEELDKSKNISGSLKKVEAELKEKENRQLVPENYLVKVGEHIVYPKSSDDVTELGDESVQLIFTSPPYFGNIRNYNLGENELGHESSTKIFVQRMVNHFKDHKRILKPEGTLWVNLGDYIQGHGYDMSAERFAFEMISDGWILHDKIIWVKNNPIFTLGKRSVLANEFIYVFKKNPYCFYDQSWVKEYEVSGNITSGSQDGQIKLRSVFDFRDNVLITNSANNAVLRKECERHGIHLTHDATFPLSVPMIALLTCSKKGDVVLDPFSGTATTGKACQILGRRYVGYELNPTYMKQGEIRLLSDNEDYIEKIAA